MMILILICEFTAPVNEDDDGSNQMVREEEVG